MATITENTFRTQAAGEQLQVRWLSPESDRARQPTLVLLHDALGSIAQWRDFPEALLGATGLPVLAYDRCGFGASQPLSAPRTGAYLEQEVASLNALLETLDVQRPLLVGHSDGATLALLYASRYSQQVVGVVSIAAHLFVEEVTLAGIRRAVERWEHGDLKPKLEKYHGAKTEQVFNAWAGTWLDPGFRNWNIEALLPRIGCPVLALQGENDEYGSVRQLKAIARRVGGSCHLRLIKASGHSPHLQARSEVLKEMTGFIATVCAHEAEAG